MWTSCHCAAALDGCMYFIPYGAHCMIMLKLDPNKNNDAMSSAGDDLGDEWLYVVHWNNAGCWYIDWCVYGILSGTKRIVKYDPI